MSLFSISSHVVIYGILLLLYLSFEIAVRYYKNLLKKRYHVKKESIHSSEEAEIVSFEHFNKLQNVEIVRIVVFVIFFVISISVADVKAFGFLAVALGAIIITLRDYVVSVVSYLYVLANFDVGDDIKIGSVLGGIVHIRPLTVSVAGKDTHGDFNGILHHIPNSKFVSEIVERQEIKDKDYRSITLHVLYSYDLFEERFSVWLENLKKQLDILLTKRSLKDVGNYKSYAGIRYKLHYDYDEDGDVVVSISFIARTKNATTRKEEIIEYVETTKRIDIQKKSK